MATAGLPFRILEDWFWECVWSLVLGVYGQNSPTKALRGVFMVVGPILAFAASNLGGGEVMEFLRGYQDGGFRNLRGRFGYWVVRTCIIWQQAKLTFCLVYRIMY